MADQLSLMNLFESGAHRGSKKRYVNPALKGRIFSYQNGIAIVDLAETTNYLVSAAELMKKIGFSKKSVLVVGTSPAISDYVPEVCKMFKSGEQPYINHRWLGGTLTNWSTIRKTLKTLDKTRSIIENAEFFDKLARNEQLRLQREEIKIARSFGGLTTLKSNRPGAVLILDADRNQNAIREADVMGIPVIAFGTTSMQVLSKKSNYTIVFNTHSKNALELLTKYLVDAYNTGLEEGIKKSMDTKTPEKDKAPTRAKITS
jgi:small subunit ribosomal protein S2